MAKAGIDNFTKWMAMEMAMKHSGSIRVNAIAPGWFVTDMTSAVRSPEMQEMNDEIPHRVFSEGGQQRRPRDRPQPLDVEDVDARGDHEATGRQPDAAEQVEADPQAPGI